MAQYSSRKMERVKDAETLQGGGSGEGFRDPEQLRYETFASRRRSVQAIMTHAKGTIFKEMLLKMMATMTQKFKKKQLLSGFKQLKPLCCLRKSDAVQMPRRRPGSLSTRITRNFIAIETRNSQTSQQYRRTHLSVAERQCQKPV